MAMINCPECGHAMSSTAAACPNCGHVMGVAVDHTRVERHDVEHDEHRHDEPEHHHHAERRVGAGRWLAGLFFLLLLILIALWYFDVVNFT